MKKIISEVFKVHGSQRTAELLDKIKELGFEYATISGMSIGIEDIEVPTEKEEIIARAQQKIEETETLLRRGLITPDEKRVKSIDYWSQARSEIEKRMMEHYSLDNPVLTYVNSGTRGSVAQLIQMAGMKGLVVNPAGEIIEIPIISNYREGLTVFEYFISSHGSRKGRSDTSLRTSDAGYLTRRLVDVAQEIIVRAHDCNSEDGILMIRSESEEFGETFAERLDGRVAIHDIKDGKKTIVKAGEEISKELSKEIEQSAVESVLVRSVAFCKETHGICQKCYGRDLATGKLIEMGVTAGVIAAQAIGEPGTQLTMKTFHLGGVSGEDITSGLPRVEELFEARRPKYEAPIAEITGIAKVSKGREGNIIEILSEDDLTEEQIIPEGYELVVKDNDEIKAKKAIAICKDRKAVRSSIAGQVKIGKGKVVITSRDKLTASYVVNPGLTLTIKNNEKVEKGQVLAEGHLNLSSVLKLRGEQEVIKYMIKETKGIYMSQGQSINDKHLEVIIKQNLSKYRVVDEGDGELVPGQVVDFMELEAENAKLRKAKRQEAKTEKIIMGITRVALKTDSFLSAASFQETTGVLINAAIRGAVDELRGLKENVIIGKLIPAGTGLNTSKIGKK